MRVRNTYTIELSLTRYSLFRQLEIDKKVFDKLCENFKDTILGQTTNESCAKFKEKFLRLRYPEREMPMMPMIV